MPPFHILGDKHQSEPFQHHLVQSSPAAENKPGFNLPAADHFNLKVRDTIVFFTEKHTIVMVIYNVETYYKNLIFQGEIFGKKLKVHTTVKYLMLQ